MSLKIGTGQACAACKYQRRRCTSECPLAPYFPSDKPKEFQNAHKLFGVKNIQNLLKDLDPEKRSIAAKSIKYQANMRERYPVQGCVMEIQRLSYEINMAEEELRSVLQQLAFFQQQSSTRSDYLPLLKLGMGMSSDSLINRENNIANGSCSNGTGNLDFYSSNCFDSKENSVADSFWTRDDTNDGYDSELRPLFDLMDIKQSYLGSKNAYESSLESSLKSQRSMSVEQRTEAWK